MLTLRKEDFVVSARSFDLRNEWNLLRIIAGAFMFPHVAGKFADWAGTAAFFAKAGFVPGDVWVGIAAASEMLAGVFLVLGLCTRFAALGAAAVLAIAAYALFTVKGFGWVWNKGGFEYPIFWAITAIAVAMHEFGMAAARPEIVPLHFHEALAK